MSLQSRGMAFVALGLLACVNPGQTGAAGAPTEMGPAMEPAPNSAAQPEADATGASSASRTQPQAGAAAPADTVTSSQSPAAAAADAPGATAESASREFHTPPVPEGYQRFEPPAIEVPAGGSDDWAQFVGGPLDQDYDVIDIQGDQSVGGHHALVYATTTAERPGTTRLWKEEDQITSRLMGGVGGEGGANVQFPPGVVFRVKKGSYILIQTHYLNATDKPILARTIVDIHLEPVDKSRTVASMMSSTSTAIMLPPHAESEKQIDCMVEKDLKFLQIANHMHDYGKTQVTDYVAPDGSVHLLKDDQSWAGDLALNPNFTKYTLDTAMVVPKGSLLRTHCTWNNTTNHEVTFPSEMCVFFGFILNENDIYCTEGKWSESKSFASDEAADEAATDATDTMAQDTAMPGSEADAEQGASADTPDTGMSAEATGCTSMADQAIMNAEAFDQQSTDCATPCALDPDVAGCAQSCLEKDVGLSHACAVCNGENIACGAKQCLSACLADSASPACRDCVMTNCDPAFRMCTGT